jgi:hypothetical protein
MSQSVYNVVDSVGKHNRVCLLNSTNDIKYQGYGLLAVWTLFDRNVNSHVLAKTGTQVEPEIRVRA